MPQNVWVKFHRNFLLSSDEEEVLSFNEQFHNSVVQCFLLTPVSKQCLFYSHIVSLCIFDDLYDLLTKLHLFLPCFLILRGRCP